MRRHILLLFLYLWVPLAAWSQRVLVAEGTYTYYSPSNIGLDQAKSIALERAQLQIIADHFGTVISSVTSTRVDNSNGLSNINVSTIGDSEVKGEWIETIGEPRYSIAWQSDMLVVNVSVKGRIREIISAPIDFKAKVLCNGTEERFERYDFNNGDCLYLSFTSPVNGYLTVYLYDGTDDVWCLLPYQRSQEGHFSVSAGQHYVFFGRDCVTNPEERLLVDEYSLTTEKPQELNRLYIIFSPNSFNKALDKTGPSYRLPRHLPYRDFQKWLAKNRKLDKEMKLEIKNLSISQNE